MKIPKLHPKLNNGYTISAIGHLIILMLFAFFAVKPNLPLKWHSFEWELPDIPKLSSTLASKGILPRTDTAIAEESSKTNTEPQASNPLPTTAAKQPRIIESPVIDTPTSTTTTTSTTDPVRLSRNRTSNALRSLGNTLPSGNYGFSADLEMGDGEAYIISQPKPMIVPDVEGEVYLEFKLSQKGGVDMNSVIVLSYTTGNYVEAVKKVLPQWRFGFRGVYSPERKYRVRCKFVLDE
ncbi:MAG: hypothetical protein CVU50_04080 [Candidatus Cloacimonetes bacterium HGW-Cloacimonetes-3]|nr:MAG: hypothetical protein CVU50_04080 [Candidatus Cloacimonetes bacterium HGW-Cloacimonetes-3]